MACASAPAGNCAVITANMALPLSHPATCKSTGTPLNGTDRVVLSGLQGNCTLSPAPSNPTSRQFCSGLQALKARLQKRLANMAFEMVRMGVIILISNFRCFS
jgi:hypothetical protein